MINFKRLYNFLQMIIEFFNYIFFFYYNLVSINKGYSLIFESLVSKIWFDSVPKFSIISYSLNIQIVAENLLQKLSTMISLSFIGKEISSTIIFSILIEKASPSHNCHKSDIYGRKIHLKTIQLTNYKLTRNLIELCKLYLIWEIRPRVLCKGCVETGTKNTQLPITNI